MPQGQRTDFVTAAQGIALKQAGYSGKEIENKIGLDEVTLWGILKGICGWDKIKSTPVFEEYRAKAKREIQSLTLVGMKAAIDQFLVKIPEASARDAAVSFGILTEKDALLAGEPTQLIAVAHHVEVEDMTVAADAIAHSLLRFSSLQTTVLDPQNQPIDVTPEPNLIRPTEKDKE